MKLRKDLELRSQDFWYDLSNCHLKPFNICESAEDAKRVEEAVNLILEFEESCKEQIKDFDQ